MASFLGLDAYPLQRALLGSLIAALIAGLAWRRRTLSSGGALAAAIIGTISIAAGYGWGALLLAFFLSSTLLSRFGRERKARTTAGIVEKGDERDAVQVLANGALFASAAVMFMLRWWFEFASMDQHPAWAWSWMAIGGGAIAAACADTWSTEIGTLSQRAPRMITTFREVPAGTSGAVTPAGVLAMLAGAAFIGFVAWVVRWPTAIAVAAAAGGVAGATVDSLAGALVQSRRRCPKCGTDTERLVHDCGTETEAAGGIEWLDNDMVNALCTCAGGLVAGFIASVVS
jgi:uncharacterized protein (TIGR00297 family)